MASKEIVVCDICKFDNKAVLKCNVCNKDICQAHARLVILDTTFNGFIVKSISEENAHEYKGTPTLIFEYIVCQDCWKEYWHGCSKEIERVIREYKPRLEALKKQRVIDG